MDWYGSPKSACNAYRAMATLLGPAVCEGFCRDVTPPVEPQVRMALSPTTVPFVPGRDCSWTCGVTSDFDCPVEVELAVPGPWGQREQRTTLVLPARGRRTVPFTYRAADAVNERTLSWDVRCPYRHAGTNKEQVSFKRALFFMVARALAQP